MLVQNLRDQILNHSYWIAVILFLILIASTSAALHAIIYKRNSRSAFSWFGIIVLVPALGSFLYYLFGINRIQKKAKKLKFHLLSPQASKAKIKEEKEALENNYSLRGVVVTGEHLGYSPLCRNICVIPLNSGDSAYPEMLKEINNAKISITLFSYIFNWDHTGKKFVEALIQAHQHGVNVRVMVDAVGSHKSRRQLFQEFEKVGIKYKVFLPVLLKTSLANMRNHRKLLIVDGEIAFTGGLNIANIYWPSQCANSPVLDFHFKLEGSIVQFLQEVFTNDWYYASGEVLSGEIWFPPTKPSFETFNAARVVINGPGESEEKMLWHFISAINAAEISVRIVTPYFLPDTSLISALCAASLRGVKVDILVPEKSDHAYINWATQGNSWELLSKGCRIWKSPPPFDHSKLFVVDEYFVSFGSANWDIRSLRLNFELNIEFYGKELAKHLNKVIDLKLKPATQYTSKDHEERTFLVKVRDGFSRMFLPYM